MINGKHPSLAGTVEAAAYRPWLEAETAADKPRIMVTLGAAPARASFGRAFRGTRERGHSFASRWRLRALATVHPPRPRAPGSTARHRATKRFVPRLAVVAEALPR